MDKVPFQQPGRRVADSGRLGGTETFSMHKLARHLKIALIFFVALQGLAGGLGNLVGLETTYGGVARVLSMEGVPSSVPRVFAFDAPIFIWVGVCWILLLKLLTGVTGAIGVLQLFRYRNGSAVVFQAAKYWGLFACGASILMLFGGFIVTGATILFMWQTQAGQVAFEGATYFLVCLGVVALYVNVRDD
jgi:predicted small integral membrane protein